MFDTKANKKALFNRIFSIAGLTVGGAQVSEKHAGFLINTGNASAADFLQLKDLVQRTVYEKYGVQLEPEVRIIGRDGCF